MKADRWRRSVQQTGFGRLNRSELMSRIRSTGNTTTELRMQTLLQKKGICGWRRDYKIKGSPDFVWPRKKVAVFVDGCFWHGHECGRNLTPKTNVSLWAQKLVLTKSRDRANNRQLKKEGWRVVRIWECRLRSSPQSVLRRVQHALTN
jgi:DNA mismatch endonuclease (patch repair protein)